ncbi:Uncharacterised protein [Shigella sonnei]|nr:Uncharacterised protein [Shigella sonnei]
MLCQKIRCVHITIPHRKPGGTVLCCSDFMLRWNNIKTLGSRRQKPDRINISANFCHRCNFVFLCRLIQSLKHRFTQKRRAFKTFYS